MDIIDITVISILVGAFMAPLYWIYLMEKKINLLSAQLEGIDSRLSEFQKRATTDIDNSKKMLQLMDGDVIYCKRECALLKPYADLIAGRKYLNDLETSLEITKRDIVDARNLVKNYIKAVK